MRLSLHFKPSLQSAVSSLDRFANLFIPLRKERGSFDPGTFEPSDAIVERITTTFLGRQLSKTRHPRKRFQSFRQSHALATNRIEIHQSQPASMT